MGTALGTVLVLIALGVLIYPFVSRRNYALADDPALERLRVARMRAYRQISDLEGDFRAGDLTVDDYRSQLDELRVAAARIMRQEERLGVAISSAESLEREIEAARLGKAGPPEGGDVS